MSGLVLPAPSYRMLWSFFEPILLQLLDHRAPFDVLHHDDMDLVFAGERQLPGRYGDVLARGRSLRGCVGESRYCLPGLWGHWNIETIKRPEGPWAELFGRQAGRGQ